MLRLLVGIPLVLVGASALVGCGSSGEPNDSSAAGASSSAAGASNSAAGNNAASSGSTGTAGTASGGASSGTAGAAGNSSAGMSTTAGSGSGGANGSAGNSSTAGSAGAAGSTGTPTTEKFSFFVTSLKAMRRVSGSQDGFGGDLSFGETGPGAGLKGADKICTTIAETSLPKNGKTWRAFLSATQGADGNVVNAIDRVGMGPWYDRTGRLVAKNPTDLVGVRPTGADAMILNDLPNEDGVPNHDPDGAGDVDNHDVLTGTNEQGKLFKTDAGFTCNDWTSKVGNAGTPHCGHSWPRMGGGGGGGGPQGLNNWMSALNESGCEPGVFIIEAGPPGMNGTLSVGDGGGYGAIYCFALTP
jgi:hypothetical protein